MGAYDTPVGCPCVSIHNTYVHKAAITGIENINQKLGKGMCGEDLSLIKVGLDGKQGIDMLIIYFRNLRNPQRIKMFNRQGATCIVRLKHS